MGKIIPFGGITKLDLDVDMVLEQAKGKMDGLVILGYTKDGQEYYASSYADGGTVNWLLDRCKLRLIQIPDAEE